MVYDPWLPIGYKITENIKVGKVLFSGDVWQIIRANDKKVLLVKRLLFECWTTTGLMNSRDFVQITFGNEIIYALVTDKQYDLSPIEETQECWDISDALAFANAMKTSRKIVGDVSFKDAIYSEEYTRLLPTYTLYQETDDESVLGYWLTSGVDVSVKSFRRLCSLLTWLDAEDVREVIETAGLSHAVDLSEKNSIDGESGSMVNSITSTLGDVADKKCVIKQIDYFQLPGRPQLEKFFNEQVIDVVNNLEKYKKMGIDFPTPTILYGPPGSGKTFAIEKLASHMDWPVFYIDSSSVASSYVHDTSKKIADVFKKATKNAPSIIIIDEMEAYLSSRTIGSESGMHHIEEVAEFLREIPKAPLNRVLIFGMTNMIEMLDKAAIRQGRFDNKLEVALPNKDEIAEFFASMMQKIPVLDTVRLENVIEKLTGRPFSDAAFVMREAGRLAVKNNKDFIDQNCLDEAVKLLPSENTQSNRKIGF